jgi:carbamoyltransferase
LSDWHPEADVMDLARSIQDVTIECLANLWQRASRYGSRNLVYAGGVALNCAANQVLANLGLFDNIWIIPNPGDAGSSIGCIAASEKMHLNWKHPFLGHNIEGEYPVDAVIKELTENKMVGVANGRAEFGPRALGNRSLFADARGTEIKDKVNAIKRRQEFRPFAPIVLEEHANEWFEMPAGKSNSPYMSFVAKCKKPEEIPAVCHADGTSRVQTVNRHQHPDLYHAMRQWYAETGCPVVLNTSLNIKGQPIVNTEAEAEEFAKHYKVKVHVRD